MNNSKPIPVYRFATSYLNGVIQCVLPMTTELAEIIRSLHRDYGLGYETLPSHLCDGDTTGPEPFGVGKVLVESASFHLHEDFRNWRPSA